MVPAIEAKTDMQDRHTDGQTDGRMDIYTQIETNPELVQTLELANEDTETT